jgi:hypothetical protein
LAFAQVRTGTHFSPAAAASTPTASTIFRSKRKMVPSEAPVLRSSGEGGRDIGMVPSYGWQAIPITMKYVYMLKSLSDPKQRYVSSATDLQARLRQHNQGRVPHTATYVPWEAHIAICFNDDRRAAQDLR